MNRLDSLRTQVRNYPSCRQPNRSYQGSLSPVSVFTSSPVGGSAAPCTQLYANSTAPTVLTKDGLTRTIDRLVHGARKAWNGIQNAATSSWNWGKQKVSQ